MSSESPLLRLPPELLQCVLLHCSWRQLVQLNATCHQLHVAVQDDRIWRHLAATEYHVTELSGRAMNTFKKLYQRLLHPYGWMIGLYWSRIDYFGGLLEIKVSGDSIIATSLRVTDEGVLEGSPSFEVCAATKPPSQLCSMIERTHVTQITQCKDRESLRQKCQFHDTKFAQGHYNYNTLNGFRAMTFIDAHRLGILHHPLAVPSLSTIPRELWTTAPPNSLTRASHGSSPNFFEGSSGRRLRDTTAASATTSHPSTGHYTTSHYPPRAADAVPAGGGFGSPSRSVSADVVRSNHQHQLQQHQQQHQHHKQQQQQHRALLFNLVAQCSKDNSGRGREDNAGACAAAAGGIESAAAAGHYADDNASAAVTVNLPIAGSKQPDNCYALMANNTADINRTASLTNGVSAFNRALNTNGSSAMNLVNKSTDVTDNSSCTNSNGGGVITVATTSMSSDSLNSCNNESITSSTNGSIDSASCDSTNNSISGRKDPSNNIANGATNIITNNASNSSSSSGHQSNSSSSSTTASSTVTSNSIGNSRLELAKLYKDTYCNPFSTKDIFGAPTISHILSPSVSGGRDYYPRRRGEDVPRVGGAGASSSSLSSLPPLPLCVEPTELPPHVLKPGLYTSHYGPNGYEIVLLEYKIREITLMKILGDQFVPTREVTVKICLPFSFSLTVEQQRSMGCGELKKLEPESSKLPLSHHQQQPFIVPPFCSTGVETSIPNTCWARYHGFGQLANLFHSQPKFSRVHVVVFSNSVFGVIFLTLNEFMMFRRIDREFARRPCLRRGSDNGND